jgi:uncharacterized protein (DUF1501 family)
MPTRRQLLQGLNPARPRLLFQPGAAPAGDVLVTVFLRGAMDAVHTVPPYAEAAYRKVRPTMGLPDPGKPGGIVDLDGQFGLHPTLAPLGDLFRAGRLAIVHASGSPDSTLSHFEAMQTMERGVSDGNSIASGWISRHLAATESRSGSPIRAIAFGDVLPKSLQGALSATAVRSLTEFRLKIPERWAGFRSLLTELYQTGADPAQTAGRDTLNLLTDLEKLDPDAYRPEGGAAYPEGEFGTGLRQVAQLIKADLGLEIAAVDLGGWDSHAAQVAGMEPLMRQLAQGLAAFHADLGDRMNRVTLAAMSEFGRRVHENSSLGTDHGRATAMFLLGGHIRGGNVYGRWPGIAEGQLDKDGNLRVTTDYRDILGEVVDRRLKNPNLAPVFPNHRPSYLGLTA